MAEVFETVRVSVAPTPILTIEVWDEAETGVAWVRPPREPGETEATGLFGERVRIFPGNRGVATDRGPWRVLVRPAPDQIVGAVTCTADQDRIARGRPLKLPLQVWHWWRGMQIVHAALVEGASGGALLVGGEGAGKTTVAMDCLDREFAFVADDQVAIRIDGTQVEGHGIYALSALGPEALADRRLPPEAMIEAPPGARGKHMIRIPSLPGCRWRRSTGIDAIVVIALGDQPGLRAALAVEALTALAPTSVIAQPLNLGAEAFRRLGELVERVPAYVLSPPAEGAASLVTAALEEVTL